MFASRMILAGLVAAVAIASPTTRSYGLVARQGIACNAARLEIVGALGDAETAIAEIEEAEIQEAAQAGLDTANGGIDTIAQAIVAGEAPPDAARADVEAGLTATAEALAGGDAGDAAVADAQTAVEEAAAAGQDVVAEC